jgi:ubiquinone biosynthesis protein COQ4
MHALAILDAPPVSRVWNVLRAMRGLHQSPANRWAQQLFTMSVDVEALRAMRVDWLASESGRRLFRERPQMNSHTCSRARLLTFAPGTFGRALGEFYLRHQFNPFAPPEEPAVDELEYVAQRLADTHDSLHIAMGYGGDVVGELEVQCFMWAQYRPKTVLIVSAFGIPMCVWKVGPLQLLRRMRAAYQRGLQSKPISHVLWEEMLDKPVEEVRVLIGVR